MSIIVITPPPPPPRKTAGPLADVVETTTVTITVPDEGSLADQLRAAADVLDGTQTE